MENVSREVDLLTTGEVARQLGCSRQHVVDMCSRGELPFVFVGAHRRVHRWHVDSLINPRLTRDQERSLWLHRAIAGRLVFDTEAVLDRARTNIVRLQQVHSDGMAARYVQRWRSLLDSGVDAVFEALTATSREAVELRQNSPFAGVLSDEERQSCLSSFRSHWRLEHAA